MRKDGVVSGRPDWHDRCSAPATGLAKFLGGTIKLTIWLVTLERSTWIRGAEILGLALIIIVAPPWPFRLAVGLPLLVLLGYGALTSLPLGMIPRKPDGAKQDRRNQDLRSRVVGFLNDVRGLEAYVQRARISDLPRSELEANLRKAQQKLMRSAADMVTVMGKAPIEAPEPSNTVRARARRALQGNGDPLRTLQVADEIQVTRGLRDSMR